MVEKQNGTQPAAHCDQSRVVRREKLHLLNDLHNVLVIQNVILAHALRLMLDGTAPDQGNLEVFHQALVDFDAKVFDRGAAARKNDRRVIVG